MITNVTTVTFAQGRFNAGLRLVVALRASAMRPVAVYTTGVKSVAL